MTAQWQVVQVFWCPLWSWGNWQKDLQGPGNSPGLQKPEDQNQNVMTSSVEHILSLSLSLSMSPLLPLSQFSLHPHSSISLPICVFLHFSSFYSFTPVYHESITLLQTETSFRSSRVLCWLSVLHFLTGILAWNTYNLLSKSACGFPFWSPFWEEHASSPWGNHFPLVSIYLFLSQAPQVCAYLASKSTQFPKMQWLDHKWPCQANDINASTF